MGTTFCKGEVFVDMPEVLSDVLVVGGGPAGLSAAIYARRAGLTVTVLEKQYVPGGQMATTPVIENYPGVPAADGFALGETMGRQAAGLGAVIVTAEVTALSLLPGALSALTTAGAYGGKTVILAMGTRRRKLDIPGEERLSGRGVSWCAVCDGNFFRHKPVAVIGGGNTALEDALYLAALGCDVTLVHRRDAFRGGQMLENRMRGETAIALKTPFTPLSIEGEEAVTGLTLRHAETGAQTLVPVSGVFVCVGTLANTELLGGALPLGNEGRILAGEDTATSIPGVFAAGDIRQKPLYQIVTAASDGAVAATGAHRFLMEC